MQEEFKQTTNLTEDQIKDEVEKEFQALLKRAARESRAFHQDSIDKGEMTTQQVEESIQSNQALLYGGLPFSGKVSRLTNNFYCNCPGGANITYLQQGEERDPDDPEVIEKRKMITDLDQCIRDGGYEDQVELLQTKGTEGEEGEKRALIVWDLFKRMRAKGYDDAKLRK